LDGEFELDSHAEAFFNSRGIVCHEFVPGGTAMNAAYRVEVLSHLWDKVRKMTRKMAYGMDPAL
jgi:hypothetical protein